MLREKLNSIIGWAAETRGYDVLRGFRYRLPGEVMAFPAAWVLPVQMARVDGRHEGYLTYKVVLHLMQLDRKYTPEQKERAWNDMELDALHVADLILSRDEVAIVENISTLPAERSLTQHGELSLKVEFEVRMSFCNDLITRM